MSRNILVSTGSFNLICGASDWAEYCGHIRTNSPDDQALAFFLNTTDLYQASLTANIIDCGTVKAHMKGTQELIIIRSGDTERARQLYRTISNMHASLFSSYFLLNVGIKEQEHNISTSS